MTRLINALTILLVIFHLVVSQECPSGTPDGCRCQNRIFDCSGLGLNSVPLSVSSLTTDFDVIDLSNNNLDTVPTGAFQNIVVTTIILRNNSVSAIRPGGFDSLNQLTTIDLQQNDLSILEQTGFNLVTSLSILYLAGNPVDCNNDGNAWLKGWLTSLDSPVLTGDCSSPGTIIDALNSVAEPSSAVFSFEAADYNAIESGVVTVTVTRTGVATTRVDFDLMTLSGTALANEDFIPPIDSRHAMLIGQTRMDIDILLIDDPLEEGDEMFIVSITIQTRGEANMGTIGTYGTATIIIQDNDGLPIVPTTSSPTATTSDPEPSTEPKPEPSTEPKPEPTDMIMTTDDADQSPVPNTKSVNVAAIVVPIILIIVIIAVIVGVIWYRQTKTINKGTTAGVRYAAVQNRGKVYGDVTAKA